MSELVRIDVTLIQAEKVSPNAPLRGRTVSGYGGAVPTRHMLKYDGRWYRVKVMQYGNGGSPYITVRGVDTFL